METTEAADPPPADEASERRLAPGYYAENVLTVCAVVEERYADLLDAAERALITDLRALPESARRLWVRLVSRRGPVFRRDRLMYPEVGDLDAAIGTMLDTGFADRGETASGPSLLRLLRVPELRELATAELATPPPVSCRKTELVRALADGLDDDRLRARVERTVGVVRPLRTAHLEVLRLLFFGDLEHDWSAFVVSELGHVRYETVSLDQPPRLFPDRCAIDDTLALYALRRRLAALTGDVDSTVELAREAAEGRWHSGTRPRLERTLVRVARGLERADRLDDALALYSASSTPPARERRARLLAERGRLADAIALCHEIVADPRDETEAVFAPRFLHRLRRQRGERMPPPRRRRRRRSNLVLDTPPTTTIERATLEALGGRGVFAENTLWRALFGLAFWDVVFAPIPGAFQHPFQVGPLDLGASFRQPRRQLIDTRLAELEAETDVMPRITGIWRAKEGLANPFVGWHPGLSAAIELACSRLSGRHLAWVCARLARDPRRYGRGLPDLFLLDEDEPGFRLVEVKGPTDQLRPEQGAWIDYLDEGGLPAEVLDVRWRI